MFLTIYTTKFPFPLFNIDELQAKSNLSQAKVESVSMATEFNAIIHNHNHTVNNIHLFSFTSKMKKIKLPRTTIKLAGFSDDPVTTGIYKTYVRPL